MRKKQKQLKASLHYVAGYINPITLRGVLLFVSIGLVAVVVNPYHENPSKKPAASHVAITVVHTPSKEPTPTTTALPKPTPVTPELPVTTPKVTPKPTPTVPAPTVVVPSPHSNVSSLVPASGSSSNSSSGGSGNSSPSGQHATDYSSTNWSGYMVADGIFTGVTATWTVPNVSGNGHTVSADGTWIGIGGVTTGDLIQTGTQDIVSANGQISMAAFYELLPSASVTVTDMAVSPGDSMSAAIEEVGIETWTIAIADNTDNQSFSTKVGYLSGNSSAEWIEEDPSFGNGKQVPFDDFGSVVFSDLTATVNGSSKTIASINPSSIGLVDDVGQLLATPSVLNGSGNGFSVTHQ